MSPMLSREVIHIEEPIQSAPVTRMGAVTWTDVTCNRSGVLFFTARKKKGTPDRRLGQMELVSVHDSGQSAAS